MVTESDEQKAEGINMNKLSNFLEGATSPFQTIELVKKELQGAGYQKLSEKETWSVETGKKYFVERNGSSLIAFQIPYQPVEEMEGFHIVCAHSDSPCFKIKEKPVMQAAKAYFKCNVEKYGGMIEESWFDRPLSIAGRIVVKRDKELVSIPVDFQKPMLIIPSLAIHMRRGSDAEKINPQIHLLPMFTYLKASTQEAVKAENEELDFEQLLVDYLNQTEDKKADGNGRFQKEDILGMDLYTYVCQKPVFMGMEDELIAAPRLDDLVGVFCGMNALLRAKPEKFINVLGIFDNEEVGSKTMQGADSDFLASVLSRIARNLDSKQGGEQYEKMLAESFMLSADNAHALHPNYVEKADPTNQPVMGGGIVLKYHGGQKYTTSGYTGAYVKLLCQENGLRVQTYHNRSDIAGGSTLGNLALSHVSMQAADIGVPQLAMHSACETASVKDITDMQALMEAFYRG